MPRAIVVQENGLIEVKDINGLEEMQAAVRGYIEAVPCDDSRISIYVNEEGLIHKLPVNLLATGYCREKHEPFARMQILREFCIVGPMIILGALNEDGYDTDISDEVIEEFNKYKVASGL